MVERSQVGGIPVFHAPAPAPFLGVLLFRVGMADERPIERGLTHLVEHLAMFGLDRETYRTMDNAGVELVLTRFWASGEPDEVGAALTAVARSLSDLPYDRLSDEIRILQTEQGSRSGSVASAALMHRFGLRAYGAANEREWGLFNADPATVEAWRKRFFTRGNVAVYLSGPIPATLDLSALPDGPHVPPPVPRTVSPSLPGWAEGPSNGIAVAAASDRTTACWAAFVVLHMRLYERLRKREARSYAVDLVYERLTGETAHVLLTADALPDQARAVRDAISVELKSLATNGPTADELAELLTLRRKATTDPYAPLHSAESEAEDELLDGEPFAPDNAQKLTDEIAALTPEAVADALATAVKSLIWLVPKELDVADRRLHYLDSPGVLPEGGEVFGPRGDVRTRLKLLPDAVVEFYEDRGYRVALGEVALLVRYATDQAITLLGDDGVALHLHPSWWVEGARAIGRIVAQVDPAVVLDRDDTSPYRPIAATPAPAKKGLFRRRG